MDKRRLLKVLLLQPEEVALPRHARDGGAQMTTGDMGSLVKQGEPYSIEEDRARIRPGKESAN